MRFSIRQNRFYLLNGEKTDQQFAFDIDQKIESLIVADNKIILCDDLSYYELKSDDASLLRKGDLNDAPFIVNNKNQILFKGSCVPITGLSIYHNKSGIIILCENSEPLCKIVEDRMISICVEDGKVFMTTKPPEPSKCGRKCYNYHGELLWEIKSVKDFLFKVGVFMSDKSWDDICTFTYFDKILIFESGDFYIETDIETGEPIRITGQHK